MHVTPPACHWKSQQNLVPHQLLLLLLLHRPKLPALAALGLELPSQPLHPLLLFLTAIWHLLPLQLLLAVQLGRPSAWHSQLSLHPLEEPWLSRSLPGPSPCCCLGWTCTWCLQKHVLLQPLRVTVSATSQGPLQHLLLLLLLLVLQLQRGALQKAPAEKTQTALHQHHCPQGPTTAAAVPCRLHPSRQ